MGGKDDSPVSKMADFEHLRGCAVSRAKGEGSPITSLLSAVPREQSNPSSTPPKKERDTESIILIVADLFDNQKGALDQELSYERKNNILFLPIDEKELATSITDSMLVYRGQEISRKYFGSVVPLVPPDFPELSKKIANKFKPLFDHTYALHLFEYCLDVLNLHPCLTKDVVGVFLADSRYHKDLTQFRDNFCMENTQMIYSKDGDKYALGYVYDEIEKEKYELGRFSLKKRQLEKQLTVLSDSHNCFDPKQCLPEFYEFMGFNAVCEAYSAFVAGEFRSGKRPFPHPIRLKSES